MQFMVVLEDDSNAKPDNENMKKIVLNGKKTICLFVCGFLIGIFLEILILEKRKYNFLPIPESVNNDVDVTCLILLKNEHERYVNASRNTWLRHCSDYYIVRIKKIRPGKSFKAFKETPDDGNLVLDNNICEKNEKEVTAKSGWAGLCKALQVTKNSHYQWLIIVPDTVVVLVENLKLFVKNLDCDEDHYYGYGVENYEVDYNSLSAGILLSRGAMKKLLQKFETLEDCDLTGKYWKNEDLYLGKYLKQLGILPKDTRDAEGRGRFHGYNMNNVIWPAKLFMRSDYNKKALYPVSKGFNCCSPFLITTDASNPDAILKLYFLFYKLTTVHKKVPNTLETKKSDGFYWKDFLREEGYDESAIENMTDEEYYKIWEKKLPPEQIYKEMRNFLNNQKQLNELGDSSEKE